jgi:uncharacterized coiled-coil protein SlyX
VTSREARLEAEVAELRAEVERLRAQLDEVARWVAAEQERAASRREAMAWI